MSVSAFVLLFDRSRIDNRGSISSNLIQHGFDPVGGIPPINSSLKSTSVFLQVHEESTHVFYSADIRVADLLVHKTFGIHREVVTSVSSDP